MAGRYVSGRRLLLLYTFDIRICFSPWRGGPWRTRLSSSRSEMFSSSSKLSHISPAALQFHRRCDVDLAVILPVTIHPVVKAQSSLRTARQLCAFTIYSYVPSLVGSLRPGHTVIIREQKASIIPCGSFLLSHVDLTRRRENHAGRGSNSGLELCQYRCTIICTLTRAVHALPVDQKDLADCQCYSLEPMSTVTHQCTIHTLGDFLLGCS